MQRELTIRPRYYRWHVDPGVIWAEVNTRYDLLDWEIPIAQTALVLVDVWSHHYLKDTEARSEAIVCNKIVPLLDACRKAGMPIVHAPSPRLAEAHPSWVNPIGDEARAKGRADWPPPAFLEKSGDFAQYARPLEPREGELQEIRSRLEMHPLVQVEAREAVIATGEELHRWCGQRGVLFLFYLGFNTNACVLMRDYGTLAMRRRGYDVILLRDCTTGMESFETHTGLAQTRGAVLFLEMFGHYSTTSDELIAGLPG